MMPNPNPYQMPMVLAWTPHFKGNGTSVEGLVFSLLRYALAYQEMRGGYTSDRVHLLLITDSCNKNAIHPASPMRSIPRNRVAATGTRTAATASSSSATT